MASMDASVIPDYQIGGKKYVRARSMQGLIFKPIRAVDATCVGGPPVLHGEGPWSCRGLCSELRGKGFGQVIFKPSPIEVR